MFTLHSITRAFYEAIRLQLVADGRLVDYTQHLSGTPSENALAYEQAKQTLAASLKAVNKNNNLIEVYKPTGFRNEGELKGSRVSIELTKLEQGDVSTKHSTYYTKNDEEGTSFTEKRRPSYLTTLEFEITTFATTSEDDFYLMELIERVFNNGIGTMKAINQDSSLSEIPFPYEKSFGLQIDNDDTAIRRYVRYEVKNVNVLTDTVISTSVVPFSTFVLDLSAYFESNSETQQGDGYPTNPLPPPVDDCATYEIALESESSKFIQHNLGYFPLIQIIDDLGNSVVGDIVVIDENRFTVSFNTPVTGKIIFGKLTTLYDSGFYNTII